MTAHSKLCFYRLKGGELRSLRLKVVDDTEDLLRKADAVLAESRSWRKSLPCEVKLAPCFADLAEDIVSLVMTFWSPDYGYMDELKEFWNYRELKWSGVSNVGETLSQSPMVWDDAVMEDELLAAAKADGLLPDYMWGKYVGWDTRSCGVYYTKEIQVMRSLQLGWNKV